VNSTDFDKMVEIVRRADFTSCPSQATVLALVAIRKHLACTAVPAHSDRPNSELVVGGLSRLVLVRAAMNEMADQEIRSLRLEVDDG